MRHRRWRAPRTEMLSDILSTLALHFPAQRYFAGTIENWVLAKAHVFFYVQTAGLVGAPKFAKRNPIFPAHCTWLSCPRHLKFLP